jgi:mono/diheme cytochrome c family protein
MNVSVMRALLAFSAAACVGGESGQASGAVDSGATAAVDWTPADIPASEAANGVLASQAQGQALYARCAVCHQQNGEGISGAFPPLANSEWVIASPVVPIRIVLHGMEGPIEVRGVSYSGVMMPYGTGQEMDDEEVAAVVSYIRSSWGNKASAVSAADVARERALLSSRRTPWTSAELRPLMKGG